MSPVLMVALPLVLIVIGIVLNSIPLSFDQPRSSPEQDPAKRLSAERETYRVFFDKQRGQAIKRQNAVGRYGWLLLVVAIGAFIWLYRDTASQTALSRRVSFVQTLASQEGNHTVLSFTFSNGSKVKYLIKSSQAGAERVSSETVSSWKMEQLRTGLSIGTSPLPLGLAVEIAH